MQSTLDTMALRAAACFTVSCSAARTATKPSSKPWSMQNGLVMLSHYLRQSLLLAILSLAPLTVAPAVAQSPQGWVQAGVLSCRLNPSIGFVIFGHQSMDARFSPSQVRRKVTREPSIPLASTSESATAAGLLGRSWPGSGSSQRRTSRSRSGASGDIGIGVGAGANVLVGGSNRSVALQPVSLEGSVALNVVAGLSQLKLRPAQL